MKTKKSAIYQLRRKYGSLGTLDERKLTKDPFKLFESWINTAFEKNVNEPNAMTLSTVDDQCRPSSRIVLLRGFDNGRFVFYTNYQSRKGHELMLNPFASLTFFWPELEKQVRIEGKVKKISEAMSDAYFGNRPRESQISALASQQSKVLKNRAELDEIVENLTIKFHGKIVPRPKHWGGYYLIPHRMEFWHGRTNRLHDRIQFKKIKSGWKVSRLFP